MQGKPDSIETVSRFEIIRNRADDYGTRLTGFLIPPVTGDYVFHIASDDQSLFFLSSDDDPGHERAIAREVA